MTNHLHERFPQLRTILKDAARLCRRNQWDLRDTMTYIHAQFTDYLPITGEELNTILLLSEAHERERSQREALLDAADEWEERDHA